jgi:excisionase family DNA binding protein
MSRITAKSEVLTPVEAARFLRVKKSKLLELAQKGRVPARKIDDEWRFLRSALKDWLRGTPDSRSIFLSQVGAFKDDETLMPMLEEIYKARGRPMVEDQDEN